MIQLGDLAEDVITGFKGAVIAYATHLHNCDRAALQPRELKDGEPVAALWFDVPQLKYLEPGVIPVVPAATTEIRLGSEVSDTLSSYKGIVTAIATWTNGCTRIGVQSNGLKHGLPIDDVWLPASQLKLVAQAEDKTSKTKPGGPMPAPKMMRNPR